MAEKDQKKGCFSCLPFLIFLVISFRVLPGIVLSLVQDDKTSSRIKESIETESLSLSEGLYRIKDLHTDSIITPSHFNWSFITSDFKNKSIDLYIETAVSEVEKAMDALNNISYLTDEDLNLTIDYDIDPDGSAVEFWGAIYRYIVYETGPQITLIAENLKEIAINEQLNSNDLLLLTITLVQNIDYQIPEEEYGIIPPLVAISREYGDCDTSALLLHTILDTLGFDTVLYYSRIYRHAMLGINTGATGEYKTLRGINYYFLEVTNSGWNIGQIASDMSNIEMWAIIEL